MLSKYQEAPTSAAAFACLTTRNAHKMLIVCREFKCGIKWRERRALTTVALLRLQGRTAFTVRAEVLKLCKAAAIVTLGSA